MRLIGPRPWWKVWPVICWKHWRFVWRNDVCPKCSEEMRRAKKEREIMGKIVQQLNRRRTGK